MSEKSARCAFNARIRVRSGYEHCRALVEDIGPCPAGLPGERKAAQYIAAKLKKAGLARVRLEPYRCYAQEYLTCTLRVTKPDLGEVDAYPGIYSGSTPARGVEAELLWFDSVTDINWSERRLRGKALLVYGAFGQSRAAARKAGVACLITVSDRQRRIAHLDGWPETATVPHINIGYWDAVRILKAGCRTVHINCRVRIASARSQNVVGLIKGTDRNAEHLSLSAHYDTMPGTPGAGAGEVSACGREKGEVCPQFVNLRLPHRCNPHPKRFPLSQDKVAPGPRIGYIAESNFRAERC